MGLRLTSKRSLILDTCALFWWHMGMSPITAVAKQAIADPQVEKFVSAATAWELGTKYRSGREPAFAPLATNVAAVVRFHGFRELALSIDHAAHATELPPHHKDPFDRMIIAQALLEGMSVATSDGNFSAYGVQVTW